MSTDEERQRPLRPWSAAAPNLAEHAENAIHTDVGALAAGYRAALVAGTTIYALMTHPPAAAWGLDWVAAGGSEVQFRGAILADERVDFVPTADGDGDGWTIEAMAGAEPRATCQVWLDAASPPVRSGEPLEPLVVMLDDRWASYGARAGDDLELYSAHNIVHPAAWPCLANRVFATQLITGSWIHTRSKIWHLAAVPRDVAAVVRSTVVERFETRAGKRAIVDCVIEVDDVAVCVVEHEAVIELS